MATKITFTNDVGIVSTASNSDGSYRWHVYERTIAGKTAIYVQREVSGVLDPEQKIVPDGSKPRISFDATLAQWLLIYEFNEQSWMLLIDETTPPAEQPIQQETVLIHMRVGQSAPEEQDLVSRIRESTDNVSPTDSYASPAQMQDVRVAASPTEGLFRVRWRPQYDPTKPDFNVNIVGFNVYLKRADTGQINRLNTSLIPFVGFGIYEYETPEVGGVYMVTQIERKGRNTNATAESRLGDPKDEVRSDRPLLPTTIRSFMGRAHGEGHQAEAEITADYDILNYPTQIDNFPHNRGEGFTSRILLTGYAPIVIG